MRSKLKTAPRLRRAYGALRRRPVTLAGRDRRRTRYQETERDRELLAQAEELARAGSWQVDLRSGLVRWSAGMYRLRGRAPGTGLMTQAQAELDIHADDAERVLLEIGAALEGQATEMAFSYRTAAWNGASRHLESRARVERAADGSAVKMMGVTLDVTHRQRYEAEMARSSRFFEVSRDLMCTFRLDGQLGEVNAPAWAETLGWSADDLRGRPTMDLVHPEDRERTRLEAAKLAEAGVSIGFVNRYRTKGGEWRWLDWRASVPLDESTIYASARDVTERVQARAALQASERQTRQILETAHDAFTSMDAGGRITDWNPQAEKTFGWERSEVLGRPLAETIIPAEARDAHRRGLKRFLRTGEGPVIGRLIELSALHRDGREFPVEFTISPLRTSDGVSFNAFLRDVSERKRTEEQLAFALEEAVESSRTKSEFVANMGHEIRTPLNGVIGLSTLLLESELSAEQREYADAVRLSGDALMTVVDDILDFSRLESGKLDLERRTFDVRAVVASVSAMVAPTAGTKGVSLVTRIEDSLPVTVCGDASRLRQVLSHLLTNAVKFTAAGEVGVRAWGEQRGAGELLVGFEIADTGIGIAPGATERIFESFAQADGSTTRRYGGTGLGLAICKRLVHLMEGEIGVHSALGEGSTFWFKVPLEAVEAGPPLQEARLVSSASRPAGAPAVAQAPVAPEGRRVLVAEGDRVNQLVAVRLLERRGFSVEVAADGREALEMCELGSYAAVFMACQLPGLDGYDTTAQLRCGESTARSTPIIAMTANTMVGDRERCLAAGMNDYVPKPVRPDALDEVIARALGVGGARGRAASALAGAESLHRARPAPAEATTASDTASGLLAPRDRSVLNEVCRGDERAISELVALFLEQCRDKVDQLAAAVATDDCAGAARLAHGLKGSSASVGAQQLAEVSDRLCQAARGDRLEGGEALQAELERTFEVTRIAFSAG